MTGDVLAITRLPCRAARLGAAIIGPSLDLRHARLRLRLGLLHHLDRGAALRDPLGDLAALAIGIDHAVVEHEHAVGDGQDAEPLGDDDDGRAPCLHLGDRLAQRFLAFGVEAGIGLVEDDEARIAEEGARKPELLALAAGEARTRPRRYWCRSPAAAA